MNLKKKNENCYSEDFLWQFVFNSVRSFGQSKKMLGWQKIVHKKEEFLIFLKKYAKRFWALFGL